jgi:hypothetical protein
MVNTRAVDPDTLNPDPAFQSRTRVLMTKNKENKYNRKFFFFFFKNCSLLIAIESGSGSTTLIKTSHYLFLGLHEVSTGLGEATSPPEKLSPLQNVKCLHFPLFIIWMHNKCQTLKLCE